MNDKTAATVDIIVPDIGDAENVQVIEVLVTAGDQVAADDSLVTLESDKASMEIPAAAAGVIGSISVAVGDEVNTGDVIGTMRGIDSAGAASNDSTDGAAIADAASAATQSTSEPVSDAAATSDASVATESAASVSSHTASNATSKPASNAASNADSNVAEQDAEQAAPASPSTHAASPTAHIDDEKIRRAHASPGVRRYAREHGADLSLIKGSGPKERILKEDVTAFVKQAMEGLGTNYGSAAAGLTGGARGIPPIPEVDFTKFGDIERVELSRINKLSAKNLHRAWLNVPMVTHHDEADITEMEAFRQQLKKEAREGDPKVTGLAFHMKALVATLKAFPKVNSSLAPDGESLIYKHYFHIGIAVDTPAGLVVPVFRDVDQKSIFELAEEMSDVSSRARAKKLKPEEMQGASMTISSLGGIGGTAFTPIVNPPEVAILGITRAKMQPVWDGTAFEPRLICPVDVSYDHRVVDGAQAARFMAHYCHTIGDIRRLLL